MDTKFSSAQKAIENALCIATTVESRSAGISESFVGFDSKREIQLNTFCRDRFNGREQAVAVELY